jgi:hypothetical protein
MGQQDVSNEEAAVETIGTLVERYEDWHLAVRRRRQPKKRTQANGVPGRIWPQPANG